MTSVMHKSKKNIVETIFCNGCNKIITYTDQGVTRRTEDYIEAKISFKNGWDGFHVLCGCTDCVNRMREMPSMLLVWYQMDVAEAPQNYSDKQKVLEPDKIVEIGIGIV